MNATHQDRSRAATRPATPELSVRDRRRVYGQNFFARQQDARAFTDQLEVPAGTGVVEVGPGSGLITEALAARHLPVVAIEIDDKLAEGLKARRLRGVKVYSEDFLEWRPGPDPVAFVGNLPFGDGTQILRHVLALGPAAMTGACFLLQAEYVGKRVGRFGGNLFNAQWCPWFGFSEGLAFAKQAFRPVPRTDTSTLLIAPRVAPTTAWESLTDYQNLVTTVFGTGHFTIGESVRAVGRGLPQALRRIRVEADTPMKQVGVPEWEALYGAAVGGIPNIQAGPRKRSQGRRGPRPSR